MAKPCSYFISSIFFLMFCSVLTGCIKDSGCVLPQLTESKSLTIESEANIETQSGYSDDRSVDYSAYLNKVWVGKEWDGGVYTYPASYFITKIEDGLIEGKITTEEVRARNPNRYSQTDNFTGTIYKGIAVCQFDGEHGNKGSILLEFKEGDEILTTIDYLTVGFIDRKKYDYMRLNKLDRYQYLENDVDLLLMKGTYLFRPYNIKDIQKLIEASDTHSYNVDLDSWGNVSIITVVYAGNILRPAVYMTDKDNNIIYDFEAPFQQGIKITNVIVEDFNGNGLKDIKMLTDYPDVGWLFYQNEDGWEYKPIVSKE